jgi:tRNA(fMet)-specific endonuclease VapC
MPRVYMLDTDISSYIIKENNPVLAKKLVSHQKDTICISSITYAELMYGAKKKKSSRIADRIRMFLDLVVIKDFDKLASEKYAELRDILTVNGTPIGSLDMLIVANAQSAGAILVTNNEKHFSKIPDFAFENWNSE